MSERLGRIREVIKEFPKNPGVYLMKNRVEKIVYVGKAKNLKARVRSYFGLSQGLSPKTPPPVGQVQSVEYIITASEVEAFLLEASLIKKHRPRYNIRLKDDKNYPYIRLSLSDDYPRLYLARKVRKDGSLFFGPYTSGWAVNDTIRFLNKTYLIRDCKDAFFSSRKRPCMTHQIGRCSAPCVELVSKKDYRDDVDAVVDFLQGKGHKVVAQLEKKMKKLADEERFEAAAKIRDNISSVKAVLEKQAVINAQSQIHQDVIGFHGDERGTLIETLHIRKGRMIGNRSHYLPHLNLFAEGEDVRDWLVSFINQYYLENVVPDEVLLPVDIGQDLTKLLQQVLELRAGSAVVVRFATDEIGQKLLGIVDENAKSHFGRYVSKSEEKLKGLELIQKKLQLKDLPSRIECFDISTFQGQETVASQVVFEDGVPSKADYRRYKIRTVEGIDDFASMKEVLERRFKHEEYDDPDLIVIDGGKGQLNIATEVLKELGRPDLAVVGLAKARTERDFSDAELAVSQERFYLPGRANPVIFPSNTEAFQILVGIRDEAHRFAITYHRKLREATTLESELDSITGLGEKRKKALLKAFPSVEDIRTASIDEIAAIDGFSDKLAREVLGQLTLGEGE